MLKALIVWITTNWNFLKRWNTRQHYLPSEKRVCNVGKEAIVRTGHGTMSWFHIGRGVHQGCILSPCFFNFYAENIMRNPGLDESQAGIKITGRNINSLSYADEWHHSNGRKQRETKGPLDESEKEELKNWLKTQHCKKIMASSPITSWQ